MSERSSGLVARKKERKRELSLAMSEEVFVCVAAADDVEQANPMEVPAEEDGTILLASITAHFPGATGLK